MCRAWLVLAGAAVLAACGQAAAPAPAPASGPVGPVGTVHSRADPALGTVLVDGSGRQLYVNDREADGVPRCTKACLDTWTPVPADAKPVGVPGFGSTRRPDTAAAQLTYQGLPLYVFRADEPGKAKADNRTDDVDGVRLHWHAAVTKATSTTLIPGGAGIGGMGS